jgi:hypothetical protein
MKIKIIVIDPELSQRTKRLLAAVVVPAILVGSAAVAWAGTLHAWNPGDTLVAKDLNDNFNAVEAEIAANFTALDARVATLEAVGHVERANLGKTGTVTTQSGSWINQVDHVGTGGYAVTFASGVFSSVPTCVATAFEGDAAPPVVECYNVSTTSVTCQANAAGTNVDTGLFLICVGP